MGRGEYAKTVYMFDFALARLYLNAETGEHIPFSTGGRPLGIVRYSSVPTVVAHKSHVVTAVSPTDDLESLLYVLLEFFRGALPWVGLPAPEATKRSIICDLKFAAYHADIMGLAYGEESDYGLLRRELFRERMRAEGWTCDWVYHWIDPCALEKGTLLPEEYRAELEFVEEREWNP